MSDAPVPPPTPAAPPAPSPGVFIDPRAQLGGLVEDLDLAPPGAGVERDLGAVSTPYVDGVDGDELLALAAEELGAPIARGTKVLEVDGRRGNWALEYDLDKAAHEPNIRAWEQRSLVKGPGGRDEPNRLRFSTLLISNTCIGILRGGVYLTEPGTSERLTFAHRRIVALFGADGPTNAVRKCLGDPGALSHADTIAEHTGYGDRARTVDPTVLS